MPKQSRSLQTKNKLATKISPRMIKRMEVFSTPYRSLHKNFGSNELPTNIADQSSPSLDSYLLDQVEQNTFSKKDSAILNRMVSLLDEKGLFTNWSIARNTIMEEFQISRRKSYDLLSIFQDLEPEGVGATSIKNFLVLQVLRHGLTDEEFKQNTLAILSYEKELINGQLSVIENKTKLSKEEVALCLSFIRNNLTHTFPRQQFSQNLPMIIAPSAEVSLIQNEFKIQILENYNNIESTEILEFLKERAETIRSILTIFFKKQQPVAYKKTGLLKPVAQKEISDISGLHASTISRIVNGKYLLFNGKLILLKNLFQRKVNNSIFSALFVKKYIENNYQKPDQQIAKELASINLNIARRTVNYYRNKLL